MQMGLQVKEFPARLNFPARAAIGHHRLPWCENLMVFVSPAGYYNLARFEIFGNMCCRGIFSID